MFHVKVMERAASPLIFYYYHYYLKQHYLNHRRLAFSAFALVFVCSPVSPVCAADQMDQSVGGTYVFGFEGILGGTRNVSVGAIGAKAGTGKGSEPAPEDGTGDSDGMAEAEPPIRGTPSAWAVCRNCSALETISEGGTILSGCKLNS